MASKSKLATESTAQRAAPAKSAAKKSADRDPLAAFVPPSLGRVTDPQTEIPKIAKDPARMTAVEQAAQAVPTHHQLHRGDAREMVFLPQESVHLVVTSPPYWTLKEYNCHDEQLGWIADYEEFLDQLDRVWQRCFEALVPGGRVVCVVGDVCLSRRKNNGRHTVVPLHASIQERCRQIGFDNVAPIFWHKIANANYEIENGSSFLGKPYEPNSVIKNDVEFILMQRKPGAYRKPTLSSRLLSVISEANHKQWFQQIWTGLPGASTRKHPAPYPVALAERLIRMYSFVGDRVLDPFVGTGSTQIAAARWGRNSIGVEVDPEYLKLAQQSIQREVRDLFNDGRVTLDVLV